MSTASTKSVASFYDASNLIYKLFAYNRQSLGVHYGFWGKYTKTIHQAMLAENEAVLQCANVKPGAYVLDAGCGVGGTAIYIARRTDVRVLGISISSKQIDSAQQNAKRAGTAERTKFVVGDYLHVDVPDNTFDAVYGIESVCHAQPLEKFLAEAYRVLKPGGRLIISDGYRKRDPKNTREEKMYRRFLYGYALHHVGSAADMTAALNQAGFEQVQEVNKLAAVIPSVRHIAARARLFLPLMAILKRLHPVFEAGYRNGIAAVSAYEAVKNHTADYAIHVAVKP